MPSNVAFSTAAVNNAYRNASVANVTFNRLSSGGASITGKSNITRDSYPREGSTPVLVTGPVVDPRDLPPTGRDDGPYPPAGDPYPYPGPIQIPGPIIVPKGPIPSLADVTAVSNTGGIAGSSPGSPGNAIVYNSAEGTPTRQGIVASNSGLAANQTGFSSRTSTISEAGSFSSDFPLSTRGGRSITQNSGNSVQKEIRGIFPIERFVPVAPNGFILNDIFGALQGKSGPAFRSLGRNEQITPIKLRHRKSNRP